MALPAQQFRCSGWVPIAPATIDEFLDLIGDWFNDTEQYPATSVSADPAARTAGAGSAWTAIKEGSAGTTIALRLKPPAGANAQGQRVMIAGVGSGAPTPKMHGSNSFATGRIFIGHLVNVAGIANDESEYQGWAHATSPYSGARFRGYGRSLDFAASITHFMVLEGKEAVAVWLRTNGANEPTALMVHGGAIIDPFSTQSQDAESDGRLYGAFGSGSTVLQQTWMNLGANNSATAFKYGTGNGSCWGYIHNPGADTGTLDANPSRGLNALDSGPAGATRSGKVFANTAVHYFSEAGATDFYIGALRGVNCGGWQRAGNVLNDADDAPLAYIGSGRVGQDSHAVHYLHG